MHKLGNISGNPSIVCPFPRLTQNLPDPFTLYIYIKAFMDTSTATFIATIVAAFIFLRWFISPEIPQGNESLRTQSLSSNRGNRHSVTREMIQMVQSIGPQLTEQQIRMDLERSGSVNETVERFLQEGNLPIPEGHFAENEVKEDSSKNLIEKYAIDTSSAIIVPESRPAETGYNNLEKMTLGWADSKHERAANIKIKREEMILRARNKMQRQSDGK